MGAHSYDDLKRHLYHKIVCSCYGDPGNPENVAVECEDCFEVLMDFDRPSEETVDWNEEMESTIVDIEYFLSNVENWDTEDFSQLDMFELLKKIKEKLVELKER